MYAALAFGKNSEKSFDEKMDSTILTLSGFDARPPAICSTSRLEMEHVLPLSFLSSGVKGSAEDPPHEEVCVTGDVDGGGAGDGDWVVVGDVDGCVDGGGGASEVV